MNDSHKTPVVAFFDDTPDFGGAQVSLGHITRYFKSEKILIRKLDQRESLGLYRVDSHIEILPVIYPSGMSKILNLIKTSPKAILYSIKILRLIKSLSVDVVIVNTLYALIPIMIIKPFIKCKVIYYVHGLDLPLNAFVRQLMKVSDLNLCVSRGILARVNQFNLGTPSFLVYNSSPLAPVREAVKLGSSANIKLAYFGRLTPEKNIELIIESLNMLPNLFHLYIIGDGVYRSSLESLVKSSDLADRVHFIGSVKNVSDYYAAIDLVCLGSKREGNPMILIEAANAGVLAVAAPCEAVKDDFSDLPNIFIPIDFTPQEYAKAIELACQSNPPVESLFTLSRNRFSETTQAININRALSSISQENLIIMQMDSSHKLP